MTIPSRFPFVAALAVVACLPRLTHSSDWKTWGGPNRDFRSDATGRFSRPCRLRSTT